MQVAVGSYLGNGVDDRAITGVGFQPDLVIIRGRVGTIYAVFKTSAMSGENALFFAYAGGYYTNRIQSLDADGFTIGSANEVNSNGITYDWQAFADNGTSDFTVGYYLGDGADNRSITGLGFQPDLVIAKRIGASTGRWRTASNTGDQAMGFGADADAADHIQALEADGFQVGTQQNASGDYYQYFAFRSIAGITAHGSYTGDDTDNRSISGLGFQPDLVWVKRNSSAMRALLRPSSVPDDSSLSFAINTPEADHIQALEADGFQVGTQQNATTAVYRWYAWKVGSTTPEVTEKAGTDTGTAGESSALVEAKEAADSGAAEETVTGRTIDALDTGVIADLPAQVTTPIADQITLAVDVTPALIDQVALEVDVFFDRVRSNVALSVMIVPQIADDVALGVDVINQDFEEAAAARVIAPEAEVTFLP